ncbi:MAG TPA: hypothetical protein PKM41_01910 [Deltaproteobacteria bacterium]|jgi:hypothetical protein|nr:hypothetical protein [Deltaproteobacteria bacterium]HOI05712.1 hypothetical protein [Deltaproteobacteria bacterium]
MRPWPAALIALSLLLTSLPCQDGASCAEINFAPLLYYQSTPEGYDLSVAGPLFQRTQGFTAVRPFFYRDSSETDVLYPLGHKDDDHGYFVPLGRFSEDKDETTLDALVFSYGRYQDETYGGVFPFYGTYSHRFGHDSLRYVLWPAYTKTVDDGIETTTILWPFLKYSEGREFQIWPLYGHVRKANSDDRYLLWPFLLRKRGTQDLDAFLPFFSYSRGKTNQGISVLWPFFTYNRNTNPRHMSLSFPWPLVRYATGAYEERLVFPLYASKVEGETYRAKTVLWPFYRSVMTYNPRDDIREQTTRILILSGWDEKTREQAVLSKASTVWPLWHLHVFPDNSSWYFPWIIPLHDEGFRRNWLPLLTLAHGLRGDGSSEVSILWRTISYKRDEDRSRFSLSFLLSYERGERYRQVGFLSDLLRWKWSAAPGEQTPEITPPADN